MKDDSAAFLVEVGGLAFRARLADNADARAFLGRLPVAEAMEDLNGREKYRMFPQTLAEGPTEAPDTIRAGEIMIWSGNTLVLFYRSFTNTYGSYARIGRIEDTAGLEAAVGRGDVRVVFRASVGAL